MMKEFRLVTSFSPKGDQPKAIRELSDGLRRGRKHQVLLGVTGSGKTFTVANVIAELNRPALVIAHNKTLAAQLYGEFRELFPGNAVEFFVSYYDYYQPEAYIPTTDTYIEKDALINDDIDRMMHSATRAFLERKDTIVVASVSCIYGIGSPQDYLDMHLVIEEGMHSDRDTILRKLIEMQYARSESEFRRGTVRVRGDVVDCIPCPLVCRDSMFGFPAVRYKPKTLGKGLIPVWQQKPPTQLKDIDTGSSTMFCYTYNLATLYIKSLDQCRSTSAPTHSTCSKMPATAPPHSGVTSRETPIHV